MKSLRVLVIDDERVICDACNLILSEEGCTVERCMTGKAGLLALERAVYDIVLLDLKLPDLEGMEILKTIRKEKPDSMRDCHDRLRHHSCCGRGHEDGSDRLSGQTVYGRRAHCRYEKSVYRSVGHWKTYF